ncbi:MAG TPA: hypothetical protein PKC43_11060 [Phycisphaerales bacterium]|nr:hypothetical protein [Phycisphaerales bacterium]HMP37973.1 hypothetical protein [Phycisphaerales bacterium]
MSSIYASVLDRIASSARTVTFLLGTDCHIGEPEKGVVAGAAEDEVERRVGITPTQLGLLRDWLSISGTQPRFIVVAGAGARAGFPDFAYRQNGAEIVAESDLPRAAAAFDVVHALKEPTAYEALLPGPIIRLGALHIGDFSAGAGIARLIEVGNWAAVIDGSYLGGVSHRRRGGFDIPLRKTMSDFAGDIAADFHAGPRLAELDPGARRAIVVGGGVAGTAATRRLLGSYGESLGALLLIEPHAETRDTLRREFGADPRVEIRDGRHLDSETLKGAGAVVIATFRENAKDFVCDHDALRSMARRGIVVDISCDEGPSLGVAGLESLVGESARRHVRDAVAQLGLEIEYVADTHLPRKRPQEASDAHGRVAVPYLAVLLQLCAAFGGAEGARDFILGHQGSPETEDLFDAMVQDLRRGMVFTGPDPVAMHVRADPKIEREIAAFVRGAGRSVTMAS